MLAAAAQPDRLVVGVDANAAAMVTASRRAAAKPSRGGLPNALFVVAAAEALPAELDGVADLVTVHFPWGSLLRGLLAVDPATMAGVTRVLRPGGALRLLVSSTVRDRGVGVAPIQAATLDALAGSYAAWGLALSEVRPATPADVTAAHSTWASAWVPASRGRHGCCAPGLHRRLSARTGRKLQVTHEVAAHVATCWPSCGSGTASRRWCSPTSPGWYDPEASEQASSCDQ